MPDTELWNWGALPRDDAVQILAGQPEGTFLVRASASAANAYSISLVQQGQVKHARINNVPGGFAIMKGDAPCATLSALIQKKMGERVTSRAAGTSSTTSQLLIIPLLNPKQLGLSQQQMAAQMKLWEAILEKSHCGRPGEPSAAFSSADGGGANGATVASDAATLARYTATARAALKATLPKLFEGGKSSNKPVEAVQLFLEGRHGGYLDPALWKQQIKAAVDWLILAAPVAPLDHTIVDVVHQLLAVRLFTCALSSNGQWTRLQSAMRAASDAVCTEQLEPLFTEFDLAEGMSTAQLGQFWHYHTSAALRQKPSQAVVEPELYKLMRKPGRLNFDDPAEMAEYVCLHAARAINLMVNARFQAKVAAVAKRVAGCRHFDADPKGFARSLVKILNDYASLRPGPGASWVCDGLRCLLTVPSVAAMHALISILNDEFAGFLQFKNPFALDEAGRADRAHLLLCNITAVFVPGCTYREMLAWPTSEPALTAMMAETASGQPAERWKRHVAAALELLRDQALAGVQVKVAVEIQLTFDSFAAVRDAVHLNYDMVRPSKDGDLWANFGGLEEEREAVCMQNACIAGQLSLVEQFLKAPAEKEADGTLLMCGGDVNARVGTASQGGPTALILAAAGDHCDVVGYLLKQPGIEVNKALTSADQTPLCIAVENGHGNVVKQLIVAKADVDKARTDNGSTPLIQSTTKGDANIVKQLLDANADVHQTTTAETGSYTALKFAEKMSHTEIVAMLVAAGARFRRLNFSGCFLEMLQKVWGVAGPADGKLNGRAQGAQLRPIMMTSKLPNDKLGLIWQMVDDKHEGTIGYEQLGVLLGLIGQEQRGEPLNIGAVRHDSVPPTLEGL